MEGMKIDINCTFRIIPFSDSLWRAAFPQLKKQLGIEQINIVESKLFGTIFKHHYDVYVDKALILEYENEKVIEMVKEKIKERIDEEMEMNFSSIAKGMEMGRL